MGKMWFHRVVTLAAATLMLVVSGAVFSGSAFADSSASDLPPSWHIHDGQTALGPQHKGIGFFPTILGIDSSTYAADPARCPNATDKAFLNSWDNRQQDILRAGTCTTDVVTIHLRTVREGVSGPEGWQSLTTASEPGWVTYYKVTEN